MIYEPESIIDKSQVIIDEKAPDEEKIDKVIEPARKKMRNEKDINININFSKNYDGKDINIKIDAGIINNINISIINSD